MELFYVYVTHREENSGESCDLGLDFLWRILSFREQEKREQESKKASSRGVIEKDNAKTGVFISLQKPTQPMRKETVSTGLYQSPGWGTKQTELSKNP